MAVKTWKLAPESVAGMQVGEEHVTACVAVSGDVNGIYIDKTGTYIRGKLSIMTAPEQIRVGGFWTQQSGWMQMFPSSTAFPNPNLILSPPIKGIEQIVKAVAFMTSLLKLAG